MGVRVCINEGKPLVGVGVGGGGLVCLTVSL